MSSTDAPDENLSDFERALAGLAPAEARLDRDRLMFDAGRAATSHQPAAPWFWPLATTAMAVLSLTLGVLLAAQRPPASPKFVQTSPATNLPIVYPPAVDPVKRTEPPVDITHGLVALRNRVLADGPEVLDRPQAGSAREAAQHPQADYPWSSIRKFPD
ncbi:MAG: hypothetical protein K8T91_24805 [Planctomycetes bacterium]|nr:hypothetical protein [Planctomycetota bacterium]